MLGLVTAEVAASLDPDLMPLRDALADRVGGDGVRIVSWDDDTVVWSDFDTIVIRSTWDYTDRLAEFLAWVDRVDAVTTLVNSADAVRWSADKRYLADLAAEGIAVTPTVFVEPSEPIPIIPADAGVHVVKPTVGAGANGARRCEPAEVADHVALLHAEGRTAMIQPYLELLDTQGETALCFVSSVDGGHLELSHAFRKGAILTSVEVEQEGDLFAKEDISPRTPSTEELDLARAVLATEVVASLGPIGFARVDIAPWRAPDGTEAHVVLELELIEPSFFFVEAAAGRGAAGEVAVIEGDATARFAERILTWRSSRPIRDAELNS